MEGQRPNKSRELNTGTIGYSDTGYSDKSVTMTVFAVPPNDWFVSKLPLLTVTIWLQ